MPGVLAASESAWSYGGAILTFVFPMLLFLTVATGLYVVFTKPSTVPGHREQAVARPIGFTPVVRLPRHEEGRLTGPQYVFPGGTGQGTVAGEGRVADPEDPAGPQGAGPENTEGAE